MKSRVTIIGLGLIGGSMALALKQQLGARITAYDTHAASLQTALELQVIDEAATSIAAAVSDADCIIIATPLDAYPTVLSTLHACVAPHTIITDVGSTKLKVTELAATLLGEAYGRFVPGHPIAGTEKSSFAAASAHLFHDKQVILTPTAHTEPDATAFVQQLWEKLGARVVQLDAATHDEMLAATSHLPQLLAYTYLQTLQAQPAFPQLLAYTGTGFKDFTRIAASNPALWADIALSNRNALLQALTQFQQRLTQLTTALAASDREQVLSFFAAAQLTHK